MRVAASVRSAALTAALAAAALVVPQARVAPPDTDLGLAQRVFDRLAIASRPAPRRATASFAAMTPDERRAAVDALWGQGGSPSEDLAVFDKFWSYADAKFAAFQGIDVDWAALRDEYRPEVAAGVSRGRLAGILNHLALALRDGHTLPLDLLVNTATLPQPGVPLLAQGGWIVDTSGACMTALDDGSALVYDVVPNHPLGLQPGDRVVGYDGVPWRQLYRQLIDEELPMWPLWWGSGPEGFLHSWDMSAGVNWHLFDTMDVVKQASGSLVHLPLSLMPGPIFSDFCAEQLDVAGVQRPTFLGDDLVRAGVVDGTNVGYIYVYGWFDPAPAEFAAAVDQLTQDQHVDGLILDFRFNVGGLLRGPYDGLSALFDRPAATIGMDERMRPDDHFLMKRIVTPNAFRVDFGADGRRTKASYDGPIAILVGPGAVSAGDFAALWAAAHPNARTFGKTTAMAAGLPTQPALGTELDLGPDWAARVAETNAYDVGIPHEYLIHTDFPVDERVWLTPDDVAQGRDTVVEAALAWLATHAPAPRPKAH